MTSLCADRLRGAGVTSAHWKRRLFSHILTTGGFGKKRDLIGSELSSDDRIGSKLGQFGAKWDKSGTR